MPEPLLVRDVMRIGVPTCKETDPLHKVAALLLDKATTALIVLDDDGDTRGWISETHLAHAYQRIAHTIEGAESAAASHGLTAADIMNEKVAECPSDIPVAAAGQLMSDMGVDHLFMLHHAGGRAWPASVLSLRDLVRVLAGPEFYRNQGAAAPRPTPLDLFRQRYGLANR